jgi:hypothetical protein
MTNEVALVGAALFGLGLVIGVWRGRVSGHREAEDVLERWRTREANIREEQFSTRRYIESLLAEHIVRGMTIARLGRRVGVSRAAARKLHRENKALREAVSWQTPAGVTRPLIRE